MKKNINVIIIGIMLLACSCEKYLDYAPEIAVDENDAFKNYLTTQGYLDVCYRALECNYSNTQMQNFSNPAPHIACISDEAGFNDRGGASSGQINPLNLGDWLGKPGVPEVGYAHSNFATKLGTIWTNSMYCQRVANRIIEKVPNMTVLSQDEKNKLLGQAYFYRAWNYFQVIRRWGGMPKFDKLYNTDDNVDFPRLSYSESTEWLISDYDKAISLLPKAWDDKNTGRPTKVSAYAARSMAALYAASPLMNNPIGVIDNHGYNKEWAQTAAKYAYETLKYIWDSIPERDLVGKYLTDSLSKVNAYRNIFYRAGRFYGDEDLLYYNSTNLVRYVSGTTAASDIVIHFQNQAVNNRAGSFGKVLTSVSQNLVDKFEVINPVDHKAYPFGHPALGTVADQWLNPYRNRDPRFNNNIFYTGGPAHGTTNGAPNYMTYYPGGAYYSIVNNYENKIVTGYMCKKWWDASQTRDLGVAVESPMRYNGVFIRTAQVYLDYAEAMNAAYGPNNNNGYLDKEGNPFTSVAAVNAVRARVAMVPVNDIFTADTSTFMPRIYNERAIELMFEDHRWHDIRRWMIAVDVFRDPYPIKGVSVTDLTPGIASIPNKTFQFTKIDVTTETRIFLKKHYWYPLPKDHVEHLYNLKQNPGW